MRFTKQKELKDLYWGNNNRKFLQKYLWLPLTIDSETRWLETANIRYKVGKYKNIFDDNYYFWEPVEFIDNDR